VSAVAGRQEIVDSIFTKESSFGGTYNANPVSLCGASVTLQELSRDAGSPLNHANQMGQILMERNSHSRPEAPALVIVTGFGAAFSIPFYNQDRIA